MSIYKYLGCFTQIYTIYVDVYSNGKPNNLKQYDDFRLDAIEKAINALWKTSKKSAIWFEVDTYEVGSIFKKEKKLEMQIKCYTKSNHDENHKKRNHIPDIIFISM